MNLIWILNGVNLVACVLISIGVFIEFGLGWALISAGAYLAYNVIMTTKVLNVRNSESVKSD